MKRYVELLLNAVEGTNLTIHLLSDAQMFTDELIAEAEALFEKALAVAVTPKQKWYVEKEFLSVLFLKASRLPLEDPSREGLIDRLYEKVKEFNITEIRERRHLDIVFDNLRASQYARSRENEYNLYYIMK